MGIATTEPERLVRDCIAATHEENYAEIPAYVSESFVLYEAAIPEESAPGAAEFVCQQAWTPPSLHSWRSLVPSPEGGSDFGVGEPATPVGPIGSPSDQGRRGSRFAAPRSAAREAAGTGARPYIPTGLPPPFSTPGILR